MSKRKVIYDAVETAVRLADPKMNMLRRALAKKRKKEKKKLQRKKCKECNGKGFLIFPADFIKLGEKEVSCFACGGAGKECPHGSNSWRHCTSCNDF